MKPVKRHLYNFMFTTEFNLGEVSKNDLCDTHAHNMKPSQEDNYNCT